LRELVREALLDTVVVSGLEYVGEVLEEERTELCGVRYRHDPERRASRAGSMPSSSTLGGRRVQVERPRVRSREGHELTLPSWRAWSARDPLEQRALEQTVLGISTRRYTRGARPAGCGAKYLRAKEIRFASEGSGLLLRNCNYSPDYRAQCNTIIASGE